MTGQGVGAAVHCTQKKGICKGPVVGGSKVELSLTKSPEWMNQEEKHKMSVGH